MSTPAAVVSLPSPQQPTSRDAHCTAGPVASTSYKAGSTGARSTTSLGSTPSLMNDSDSPQTSSDGLSPKSQSSHHNPAPSNPATSVASAISSAASLAASTPPDFGYLDPTSPMDSQWGSVVTAMHAGQSGDAKAGVTSAPWETPSFPVQGDENMSSWEDSSSHGVVANGNAHSAGPSSFGISSLTKEELQRGIQIALSRGMPGNADTTAWAAAAAAATAATATTSGAVNTREGQDDELFKSIIQPESFATPAAPELPSGSDVAASPQCSSSGLTAPFLGTSEQQPAQGVGVPAEQRSSSDARFTTAQYSRRTSFDRMSEGAESSAGSSSNDGAKTSATAATSVPEALSRDASKDLLSPTPAQTSAQDADLSFSSSVCVRPPLEELRGLQIHVHGIAVSGHKSRVETQIRTRLELVRPAPASTSTSTANFERIGTFDRIKLPPLTATKRKSRKFQVPEVEPHRVLFLDAAVVNATPPHQRVYVCKSCREREKKRQNRRKGPKGGDTSEDPTPDEMRSVGVDPSEEDAVEKARRRIDDEDRQRVVLFNCGDYVDFGDGNALLPTRITCYCRHHKESTGFCIIYTMRDWRGSVIATGSTPPIMITDDHKSSHASNAREQAAQAAQQTALLHAAHREHQGNLALAAAAAAAAAAQKAKSRPGSAEAEKRSEGGRTTLESNATRGTAAASSHKKDRKRVKPYGEPSDLRSQRRSLNSSGQVTANPSAATTPLATRQSSPVTVASPPISRGDSAGLDAWNALSPLSNGDAGTAAAIAANRVGIAPIARVQGANAPPLPHLSVHPAASSQASPETSTAPPMSAQQQQHQHRQHQGGWFGSASQGSLSAQTLDVDANSLPNFDYDAFLRAGTSESIATARPIPSLYGASAMSQGQTHTQSLLSPTEQVSSTSDIRVPAISKLIPGEGPTSGGIEVTVLGENFFEGLTCVFGDVPATHTRVWASNTLVCVLPPSPSPGPVVVDLKGMSPSLQAAADRQRQHGQRPLQLFSYVDTTDRALMELALQVVGLQMTGQMQSARDVAMRVVGSGSQHTARPVGLGAAAGTFGGQTRSTSSFAAQPASTAFTREAVTSFFAGSHGEAHSFQQSMVQFLTLLDVRLDESELPKGCQQRSDAICLANKHGHTLLHLATMLGFHRLTLALLQRGCPPNARDHNGYTALHFAALLGRVTIARTLLAHGARDDLVTAEGKLAVQVAFEKDEVDVEQLLLDRMSEAARRTCRAQTRRIGALVSSNLLNSGVSMGDNSEEFESSELDDDNLSSENFNDSAEVSEDDASEDESDNAAEDGLQRAASPFSAREDSSECELRLPQHAVEAPNHRPSEKRTPLVNVPDGIATTHRVPGEKEKEAESEADKAPSTLKAAAEAGQDEKRGTLDGALGLKALTNRLQLPQGFGFHLPPGMHFHMPAVPVFHLAVPNAPSFIANYVPRSFIGSEANDASQDAVGAKAHGESAEKQNAELGGKALEDWLSPPPPTYESALASPTPEPANTAETRNEVAKVAGECTDPEASRTAKGKGKAAVPQGKEGKSRSRDTLSAGPSCHNSVSRRAGLHACASTSASTSTSTSLAAPTLPSSSTPASASAASVGLAGAATKRARRQLRDDAMLIYFWLPALIVVLTMLLVTNPTSVLSFADLASYMPMAGA